MKELTCISILMHLSPRMYNVGAKTTYLIYVRSQP